MFLSSYKRPTNNVSRQPANRSMPGAALSGTSLARPNAGRPVNSNEGQDPSRPELSRRSTEASIKDENIVIHVCDDVRRVNRDFSCPRGVLISEMKYFEAHLESQPAQELEISVHCDVEIFEWLISYMLSERRPELEVNKVVSILISSEFLQMHKLVTECLHFMKDNLDGVVALPIDMSCISPVLLKRLINILTPLEIDRMKDRKDKLQSKMFLKKLESLLADENSTLNRCVYCNKLFTNSQKEWMVCEKARHFIDFHGEVCANHVPDKTWQFNKFMLYLKDQGLTWKQLYWRIWGLLLSFKCKVCGKHFVGAEMGHCSYHPESPEFVSGSNMGSYPCCQAKAMRFDTSIVRVGCKAKQHQPEEESPELDILMSKIDAIEEPFVAKNEGFSIYKALQKFTRSKDEDRESEDSAEEIEDSFVRKVRKDQNPAKARAWKLDGLRLNDYQNMRKFSHDLEKMRKKMP